MTDDHSPRQVDEPGERWTFSELPQLQELFRLLGIPPQPGYSPVAITAVGVVMSPVGGIAHYPVYAQLIESKLSETSEIRAAVAILQQWLFVQRQRSKPGDGLPSGLRRN